MSTSSPTSTASSSASAGSHLDYLIVDRFLSNMIGSRALKSALDMGVIDALEAAPLSLEDVAKHSGGDIAGAGLMMQLLEAEGIVANDGQSIELTPDFRRALQFRDLLETKLDFVGFVLLDFVDHFNALVTDSSLFMQKAQLFRLFDYQRSMKSTQENYAWTKVWMRLTTALTRYEADAGLASHDFGAYKHMLDIGGNSGEFVLRACKAHEALRATVMDLPVVCEFGQDHVLGEPEHERISFVAGSALTDPIPTGCDLISFKSMLHDWPDIDTIRFLDRAIDALEPGGTLMIFERGPFDFAGGPPPLSLLPVLLFARSYRGSDLYEQKLLASGFTDIDIQHLELDSPFFLLTARKPLE